MSITVRDQSGNVNNLGKLVSDRKINEFTRSINSIRIVKAVVMMNLKVSKDKYISRGVDSETLQYQKLCPKKDYHESRIKINEKKRQ